MTARYRDLAAGDTRPNWKHAHVAAEPGKCVHCGEAALLRHPLTGRPCHKTCSDQRERDQHAATEQRLTRRAAANRPISGA